MSSSSIVSSDVSEQIQFPKEPDEPFYRRYLPIALTDKLESMFSKNAYIPPITGTETPDINFNATHIDEDDLVSNSDLEMAPFSHQDPNSSPIDDILGDMYTELDPLRAQRRGPRDLISDIDVQRRIFAVHASVYGTLTLAFKQAFPTLSSDAEILNIMRTINGPESQNLWDSFSVVFERIYNENTPPPMEGFLGKILHQILMKWRYLKCYMIIQLLSGFFYTCIEKFSRNVVDSVNQGLQSENSPLEVIGSELIEILDQHLGKYLHALETFEQEQEADNVEDHIALQMQTFRGQTKDNIIRDFSKVLAKYMPNFSPFEALRSNNNFLFKILGHLLTPIEFILNKVLKWRLQKSILPSLIDGLFEQSVGATSANPFNFALNRALSSQMNKIIVLLREETGFSRPNPQVRDLRLRETQNDQPDSVGIHLLPGVQEKIRRISENLMDILRLRRHSASRTRMRRFHEVGERENDATLRTLSLRFPNVPEYIREIVEESVEEGVEGVSTFGLKYLSQRGNLQELFQMFLETTNSYWTQRRVTENRSALNRAYVEEQRRLSNQMNCLLSLGVKKAMYDQLATVPNFKQKGNVRVYTENLQAKRIAKLEKFFVDFQKDTHQKIVKICQKLQELESSRVGNLEVSQILERLSPILTELTSFADYLFVDNRDYTSNQRKVIKETLVSIASLARDMTRNISAAVLALNTTDDATQIRQNLVAIDQAARRLAEENVEQARMLQAFSVIRAAITELENFSTLGQSSSNRQSEFLDFQQRMTRIQNSLSGLTRFKEYMQNLIEMKWENQDTDELQEQISRFLQTEIPHEQTRERLMNISQQVQHCKMQSPIDFETIRNKAFESIFLLRRQLMFQIVAVKPVKDHYFLLRNTSEKINLSELSLSHLEHVRENILQLIEKKLRNEDIRDCFYQLQAFIRRYFSDIRLQTHLLDTIQAISSENISNASDLDRVQQNALEKICEAQNHLNSSLKELKSAYFESINEILTTIGSQHRSIDFRAPVDHYAQNIHQFHAKLKEFEREIRALDIQDAVEKFRQQKSSSILERGLNSLEDATRKTFEKVGAIGGGATFGTAGALGGGVLGSLLGPVGTIAGAALGGRYASHHGASKWKKTMGDQGERLGSTVRDWVSEEGVHQVEQIILQKIERHLSNLYELAHDQNNTRGLILSAMDSANRNLGR